MGLFSNFPYTNFHELNLDWLIRTVKKLETAFPEGVIGIIKGGTGADNAADARSNLEIRGDTIPMEYGNASTINDIVDNVIAEVNDINTRFANNITYKIFKSVSSLGLTPGAVNLGTVWATMSIGEILIAPPTEFASGVAPESSGALVVIRNGGTSGSIRFYGNNTYSMDFVANYPSGTWKELFTNADVIPIANGGTGANNAADAIANLGIDFSGEVLSVAGVGANSFGDVPLKATDLIPTSVTELGLPSGSTVSAIYSVMDNKSAVMLPSSEVGDAPNANGIIVIVKDTTNNLAIIEFYGKDASAGDYKMGLNASNVPSGTWYVINDSKPYAIEPQSSAVDNLTVNAGAMVTADWTFPVKAGYSPIMVYNVNLNNATNGGGGSKNCYIGLARIDATKAYFRVLNNGSTSAKIKIACRVLYMRTLA